MRLPRILGKLAAVAPAAPADNPRACLKAALAEREVSKEAMAGATAAVARVRQVIENAVIAEDEAEEAQAAAAAATRVWAEAGAPADAPSDNPTLTRRASDATRRAAEAKFKADGAKAGLPQVESAAEDARHRADSAASEVQDSIRRVLLAEVEADFEILERVRDACNDAERRIRALAHVLHYGKLHGIPNHGQSQLLRRLDEVKPRNPSDDELRELSRPWVDFARRLATAPDSEWMG
jgi:hypothetical protein